MRRACCCTCHAHAKAQYHAAVQHERWSDVQDAKQNPMLNVHPIVDVSDVLEAALACPLCLDAHCEALLVRRHNRVVDPTAWVDPDPPKVTDGEGPE